MSKQVELKHKDGVKFNETPTPTAKQIRTISVFPPFDMVAFYDGVKFTQVTCSCGWLYSDSNEQHLVTEARLHNHHVNYEFCIILGQYGAGRLGYDEARRLLIYHGMSESKADDWLDRTAVKY